MAARTIRSPSATNATNCKWPHVTPPTHRGKLYGPLKRVAFGATSGVCVPYCVWNGSVTVLTAKRWQRKALLAGICCITSHAVSRHIPELRHRVRQDELAS